MGMFDKKPKEEKSEFEQKEKLPMTFEKLLEELKGGYVLEQVKDKPVLVNGKPIDHISFGENGVDFVSKE